jgi:hypothetical protein
MRKFTVTLTAAALVLGTMGLTASAQEQRSRQHSRTQERNTDCPTGGM